MSRPRGADAAPSVCEPDRPESAAAIIAIMRSQIGSTGPESAVRRIDGQRPQFEGQTARFMDPIGVGGGAGHDFHGVSDGPHRRGLR